MLHPGCIDAPRQLQRPPMEAVNLVWRDTKGLHSVCRERPLTLRPFSSNRSTGGQIRPPHPTSSPLLADESLVSTPASLRSQHLSVVSGDKKRIGSPDRQGWTCTDGSSEYAPRKAQIRPLSTTMKSIHVAANRTLLLTIVLCVANALGVVKELVPVATIWVIGNKQSSSLVFVRISWSICWSQRYSLPGC